MGWNPLQTLASNISSAGRALNLPEMRISESIWRNPMPNTQVRAQTPAVRPQQSVQPQQSRAIQTPSNYVVPSKSGGDVLGANTTINGGSQVPTNTSNIPLDLGSPGAQQEPDFSGQISEYYEPYRQELDRIYQMTQEAYGQQEADLGSSVANQLKQYDVEGQNLTQDTTDQQNKYNASIQSALSDAMRAYNALGQQRIARFGGGSSAGQAVGELAQQEYFKQQGNVQQKAAEGALDFGKEFTRINQYVSKKKDDLDQYRKEATTKLRSELADKLQEISMRKADIEANKTKDRLAALQSTVDQARQIAQADKEFRQNLALAATSKLQEVSGRQFGPQEWSAYINAFVTGFQQSQGPSTIAATKKAATPGLSYNPNIRNTGEDELNGLLNA